MTLSLFAELFGHYPVGARARIVRKIRSAVSVIKGIARKADTCAHQGHDDRHYAHAGLAAAIQDSCSAARVKGGRLRCKRM